MANKDKLGVSKIQQIREFITQAKADKEEWDLRMDDDYKRFAKDPYTLKDYKNKKIKGGYSHTGNEAYNFLHAYCFILERGVLTPKVRAGDTSMDDTQCTDMEARYLEMFKSGATNWEGRNPLSKTFIGSAFHMLASRGGVATRVINQPEAFPNEEALFVDDAPEERIVNEYMMTDIRNCYFTMGANGKPDRMAVILNVNKSQAMAMYSSDDKVMDAISISWGNDLNEKKLLTEYTDNESIVILIEDVERYSIDNPWGYVNWVVDGSGLGIYANDPDTSDKYMCESILGATREILEAKNQHNSVIKTKGMESFRAALAWKSSDHTTATNNINNQGGLPDKGGSAAAGSEGFPIVPMGEKDSVERFYPLEDMTNADMKYGDELEKSWQMGSFSALDFGQFNSDNPPAASLMRQITDKKEQIILPVKHAAERHFAKLARMSALQMIVQELDGDIGSSGIERTYSHTDFKGKYELEFEMEIEIPERQMANIAIAKEHMALGAPLDEVFRIAEYKDPEMMARKASFQKARELFPAFGKYMIALDVINLEMVDTSGVKLLALELGVSIDELLVQAQKLKSAMVEQPSQPSIRNAPMGMAGGSVPNGGVSIPAIGKGMTNGRGGIPTKPAIRQQTEPTEVS